MSHHWQAALITPTSLIKDTHLFWCMCMHDECAIQTMPPSPMALNARKLLHNTCVISDIKWNWLELINSHIFFIIIIV